MGVVVDGETGEALGSKIGAQAAHLGFVAGAPASAVNGDDGEMRAGESRLVKVSPVGAGEIGGVGDIPRNLWARRSGSLRGRARSRCKEEQSERGEAWQSIQQGGPVPLSPCRENGVAAWWVVWRGRSRTAAELQSFLCGDGEAVLGRAANGRPRRPVEMH